MKIKQRSRKQSFLLRLRFRRLRSSENQFVGVVSRNGRTKPIIKRGNEHRDWFILPLLLPTPTIWFSLDRKRRNRKRSRKKMETFWFFRLRFRRAYDSAYDSDFWFSLGHKRSYDSAYDSDSDSVASENQPLGKKPHFWPPQRLKMVLLTAQGCARLRTGLIITQIPRGYQKKKFIV